jgi:hypothetical protein
MVSAALPSATSLGCPPCGALADPEVVSPAGSSRSVAFWDDAAQRRPHLTHIASPATPLRDPAEGFVTIRLRPAGV